MALGNQTQKVFPKEIIKYIVRAEPGAVIIKVITLKDLGPLSLKVIHIWGSQTTIIAAEAIIPIPKSTLIYIGSVGRNNLLI